MLFLGHIAVSLLLADATDSDRASAVAGNLLPDIIDKTGGWVLRVMPSGRWLAHGLPFFAAVLLASRLVLQPRQWRGFALGYGGHLLGDLYGGASVPWLAPFGRVRRRRRKKEPLVTLTAIAPEVVGAAVIWRLLRPGRQ